MSTTYNLRSAASDVTLASGSATVDVMDDGTGAATTISPSPGLGLTVINSWVTPDSVPGVTGVNDGTYTVKINVTTANSSDNVSVQLYRRDSAGTLHATGQTATQTAGSTGVLTFSVTPGSGGLFSLGTWAATDRLGLAVYSTDTATKGGVRALSFALDDGSSNIVAPWTPVTAPPADINASGTAISPVAKVTGTGTQVPPSFTGSGGATPPRPFASGTGSATLPSTTGSGGAKSPVASASGSGAVLPPPNAGSGSANSPIAKAAGSGSTTVPTYTGSGGSTGPSAKASGSGSSTAPGMSGAGSATAPNAKATGSGTEIPPTYAGSGTAKAPQATGSGSGTATVPTYAGSGEAVSTATTAHGAGSFRSSATLAAPGPTDVTLNPILADTSVTPMATLVAVDSIPATVVTVDPVGATDLAVDINLPALTIGAVVTDVSLDVVKTEVTIA